MKSVFCGAALAASLVSFTRIPFPWRIRDEAFRRATWHLPFIGWLNVAALAGILSLPLPDDGRLFLCLLLPILISGAMHEDGLADAADGLLGGQSRERRLEIMKDPRVGSYGVIAVVLVMLGQFLALRTIPSAFRITALAFALPMSRCIAALLSQALPYARPNQSRAAAYISRSWAGCVWPLAWTFPVFFIVAADLRLPLLGMSLGACGILGFLFHRKLGGVSGDCLGAAVKVCELLLLWIFATVLEGA